MSESILIKFNELLNYGYNENVVKQCKKFYATQQLNHQHFILSFIEENESINELEIIKYLSNNFNWNETQKITFYNTLKQILSSCADQIGLDPMEVFRDDLNSNDLDIVLDTIRKIPIVAKAIGPQRTATELFSTLDKYCFPVDVQAAKSPESYRNTDINMPLFRGGIDVVPYSNNNNKNTSNNTIGLSIGGANDINTFRNCINNNIMPTKDSITYTGLLNEYYFDVTSKQHIYESKQQINDKNNMLFYPTYCNAKIKKLNFENNEEKNKHEYYMCVGLNSNIKQNDFKRKHLNLVIVCDQSGSMGLSFNNNSKKKKIQIANEAIIILLTHLTENDRFGLVLFDDKSTVIQKIKLMKNINLKELKKKILSTCERNGTNFECGYNGAIHLYKEFFNEYNGECKLNNDEYDNRIIFLTDAIPNTGITDPNSLLSMVKKYAMNKDMNFNKYIYTTFIGIGLQFNANLIEMISQTRGCNYFSVQSANDFIKQMKENFEHMVTPLLFNICLKINCEGNSCKIEKVYGSNNEIEESIINNGEIVRINSLFSSQKSKEKGGSKGGIQLIRLAKLDNKNDNINVEIQVTFEDNKGNKYKNVQNVCFKTQYLISNDDIINNNDMIENDKVNFYGNNGIRKAIVLCQYVQYIKNWINDINCNGLGRMGGLIVDDKYKNIFKNLNEYIKMEMKILQDDRLQKELDILQKLINS